MHLNIVLQFAYRLVYAAARGGHLVSLLSMIDVKYNSPSTSIVFTVSGSLFVIIIPLWTV